MMSVGRVRDQRVLGVCWQSVLRRCARQRRRRSGEVCHGWVGRMRSVAAGSEHRLLSMILATRLRSMSLQLVSQVRSTCLALQCSSSGGTMCVPTVDMDLREASHLSLVDIDDLQVLQHAITGEMTKLSGRWQLQQTGAGRDALIPTRDDEDGGEGEDPRRPCWAS